MVLVESFSGIRGIYGTELNEEVIIKYANSYNQWLVLKKKTPKIIVGRDTRPSGPDVFNHLIKGLNDCEIIDVGVLPTAAIENAVRAFGCDGGIIITASHNEPIYNGFKFLDFDGAVLRPDDIDFIINRVHQIKKVVITSKKNNIINKRDEAIKEYKKFLKNIIKTEKIDNDYKVLVDPNGGTGSISKEIFEEFKIKCEFINMEEGKFFRLVEPNETSLKYLVNEIKRRNCQFAIGFDCDADRAEIVLDDGSLVSGNDILALLTEEILTNSKENQKTVVVNDATSYLVKEIALKYAAKWIEVEVGEINVTDKMIETKAQIAGEGSNGGVIIPPARCRDGILTFILLMKLIKSKNKSLKELIKELPKYHYIKEKVKLKEDFIKLRNKVKEYYIKNGFEILETGDYTGGLKAIKDNSWIWFRQSKTEDKVLRIIADSKNRNVSLGLIEEAKNLLK